MASKLLGISFETMASLGLVLKPLRAPASAPASWGVAWYPEDDAAATVIKNPTDRRDDVLNQMLRQWDRFRSTVFTIHTRGAAKRSTQQDAQPFVKSFAKRDLIFAHSGDLKGKFRDAFPLGSAPSFEPVGRTDSELVFCWILEQMRSLGVRTLAEAGWHRVHGWLQQINAHGTANILLTDGMDLLAYRDVNEASALYQVRRIPPHKSTLLANQDVEIDISSSHNQWRTHVIFAAQPLSDDNWTAMEGAQMVVARLGHVVWNSKEPHTSNDAMPRESVGLHRIIAPQESLDKCDQPLEYSPNITVAMASQAQASVAEDQETELVGGGSRLLHVEHETTYNYARPVERSVHTLRLQPVSDAQQQLLAYELSISPEGNRRDYEDVFGNRAAQLKLSSSYTEFRIRMTSKVRISGGEITAFPHERVTVPLLWMPWQRQLMHAYLLPPELPETQLAELSDFAMSFVERQDYDLVEALRDMNRSIYQDFQYVSGSTTLETTPFEVYVNRRGVCQDFANLFICMARLLSVPARYRVGYIFTGANYENKIQSEASHAWAEVYLPAIGWRGFDPTNGCDAGMDHIRVATGRNYRDATPTSGTILDGGGDETLRVSVKVHEEPAETSRS